jgi:hypothetical protein
LAPKTPKLGQLRNEFGRKPALFETSADQRADTLVDKAAHRLPDHLLLIRQEGVETVEIDFWKTHHILLPHSCGGSMVETGERATQR